MGSESTCAVCDAPAVHVDVHPLNARYTCCGSAHCCDDGEAAVGGTGRAKWTTAPLPPAPTCQHGTRVRRWCDRCDAIAARPPPDATVLVDDDPECGACGGVLDADCDHCCAKCLDGNVCPACASPALDEPAMRAVLDEVADERVRQHARWGQQDLPDGTGGAWSARLLESTRRNCERRVTNGTLTFADILAEEIAEASAESDPVPLRAELVQCAAVITQWIEAIDRRSKEAPIVGGDLWAPNTGGGR